MSQLDILSAICNLKYLCNTVQIFDVNGHYVNCSNKILELELEQGFWNLQLQQVPLSLAPYVPASEVWHGTSWPCGKISHLTSETSWSRVHMGVHISVMMENVMVQTILFITKGLQEKTIISCMQKMGLRLLPDAVNSESLTGHKPPEPGNW